MPVRAKRVRGRSRRRCRGRRRGICLRYDLPIRQRRDLIGHQLLDLMQPRYSQCFSDIGIRRGRPHAQAIRAPLDDRILVLLLDPAMHNRIFVSEFQFTDLTLAVDAGSFIQLASRKDRLPFVGQFLKPKLDRSGGIDALGTVSLHPAKRIGCRSTHKTRNPNLSSEEKPTKNNPFG